MRFLNACRIKILVTGVESEISIVHHSLNGVSFMRYLYYALLISIGGTLTIIVLLSAVLALFLSHDKHLIAISRLPPLKLV